MTETQAQSLPELAQSPWFERYWSSAYEAFGDGRIDITHVQKVFARYLPKPEGGNPLWIGIDASNIARHCCHVWALLLNHPNLVENRKAG